MRVEVNEGGSDAKSRVSGLGFRVPGSGLKLPRAGVMQAATSGSTPAPGCTPDDDLEGVDSLEIHVHLLLNRVLNRVLITVLNRVLHIGY